MAKRRRVVWTKKAQKERIEILKFWTNYTESTSYSIKLNALFLETLELLKSHPKIGRKTDIGDNIRVKFIRNYKVFYQVTENTIYILTIWDVRRNPDDFEL